MIIITEICLMPPKYRVVNLAGKILCYTTNGTYKSVRKQLSTVVNFRDRNTIDFAIRIIENNEISIVFKELKGFDSIEDNYMWPIKDIMRIEQINFYNNDVIPQDIRYMTQLTHLVIDSLDITELPDAVCELVNLVFLDVLNTILTDLPLSLKKLKKLEHLTLVNNRFPRIPIVISKLISIKSLQIYGGLEYRAADYSDSIIKFKLKKPHLAIN